MQKVTVIRNQKAVIAACVVFTSVMWASCAFAITWGEPDFANEYPNVGAFMVEFEGGDGSLEVHPLCSGTLIHQRVFLTAAHCTALAEAQIETGQWTKAYVSFDPELDPTGVTLLEVAEIITHPQYADFTDPSNSYDVGLLVLAEPANGIEPAELPTEGLLDELKRLRELRPQKGEAAAEFTMVGYGGVLDWHGGGPDGAGAPPVITYEDQRAVAESAFVSLLPTQLHLDQNTLKDNEGACYGDSGGPAFWEPEAGTRVLVGITSWGDRMCVATGFSYRVDIADTLDFIEAVIALLPQPAVE